MKHIYIQYALLILIVCQTAFAEVKEVKIGELEKNTANTGKFDIISGNISFDFSQCGNSTTEAFWWTPSGDSSRKKSLILYMPFPNENFNQGGLAAARLASDGGFTVLAVTFKTPDGKQDFNTFDKNNCYFWKKSGYPDAVMMAKEKLSTELNCPFESFYTCGFSGGGAMAQHMSEWFPQICNGVMSYGGHTFIQSKGTSTPSIFMHAFGDAGIQTVPGVLDWIRGHKGIAVAGVVSGDWGSRGNPKTLFNHHPRNLDQGFMVQWLCDLHDLKKSLGATTPFQDSSNWKYRISVPGSLLNGDRFDLRNIADHWPPKIFVADNLNAVKSVPQTSVNKKKDGNLSTIPLPGSGSVLQWMRMIPSPFLLPKEETINNAPSTSKVKDLETWWCPPPPSNQPQAICWIMGGSDRPQTPEESGIVSIHNDVRNGSDKGFITISNGSAIGAQRRIKIRQELEKLCPSWSKLPNVYLFDQMNAMEIRNMQIKDKEISIAMLYSQATDLTKAIPTVLRLVNSLFVLCINKEELTKKIKISPEQSIIPVEATSYLAVTRSSALNQAFDILDKSLKEQGMDKNKIKNR